MVQKENRPIIIWLFTGCFLIYCMVVIGGITRLTHSGLSMVEWNMILGSKPPMSEADWQIPFEKYKQSPEYQLINSHFTLEEFKSIYWWEYIHRFLGRTIGVVFLIPFIYFLVRKKLNKPLIKKLSVLLLLGAFQGVLGWYMVKSGLNKNPYVSHYRLAAHLFSAFTVFGFTFWVALGLMFPEKVTETSKSFRNLKRLGIFLLTVVSLQIIYGAFVAGLKAGYAYTTFPKMGDEWMPDAVTAMQPFWKNLLENGVGVQFIHRCIAYIVVALVIFFRLKADEAGISKLQRRGVNLLIGFVFLQFFLGIITLIYAVPILMGVLHQMGAFFLFSSVIFMNFLLYRKSPVTEPEEVVSAATEKQVAVS